jgi:hypothetical protein
MGAFCYPEGGPVIAAGLSGIQGVIDLLFGGKSQKASGDSFVTQNDLDNAITEVKQAIGDALLKKDLDDNTTEICTLQDSFNTTMSAVLAGKGFASGTRYSDIENNTAWQGYYDAQRKPIYDPSSALKKVITGLTRKTDTTTQYQTAIMFTSAVGMFMNYCQLLMLIEYCKEQNKYQDAYDVYAKAKAAYDAVAAKGKHHGQQLPAAPVPPADLPDSYQQLVGLPSSDTLDGELKKAIAYLEPLVTTLEALYAELASEPAARMAKVDVSASGGGWVYVDHATGYTSFVYGTRAQADMALQIYQDTLLGTVEQAVRDRYQGMSIGTEPIVSKDDAASLREILDGWEKCRADYAKLVAQAAGS